MRKKMSFMNCYFWLSFLLLYSSCNSQDSIRINKVLRPGEAPFEILDTSKTISLPDSLKIDSLTGVVVFHFFVDSLGENYGINIALLNLYSPNGDLVFRYTEPRLEIVAKETYPLKVLRYYDFLIDYAKKIKIGEIKNAIRSERNYILRLPRRIE